MVGMRSVGVCSLQGRGCARDGMLGRINGDRGLSGSADLVSGLGDLGH